MNIFVPVIALHSFQTMLLPDGVLPLAADAMIFALAKSPEKTICDSTGWNEMKPCDKQMPIEAFFVIR